MDSHHKHAHTHTRTIQLSSCLCVNVFVQVFRGDTHACLWVFPPKAAIIRDSVCVYLRMFTPMRPCSCCQKNVDYRLDLAAAAWGCFLKHVCACRLCICRTIMDYCLCVCVCVYRGGCMMGLRVLLFFWSCPIWRQKTAWMFSFVSWQFPWNSTNAQYRANAILSATILLIVLLHSPSRNAKCLLVLGPLMWRFVAYFLTDS